MEENKALICERLCEALKLTIQYGDLIDLDYIKEKELVVAHFENGSKVEVNVACDSGSAMIRDVMRALR